MFAVLFVLSSIAAFETDVEAVLPSIGPEIEPLMKGLDDDDVIGESQREESKQTWGAKLPPVLAKVETSTMHEITSLAALGASVGGDLDGDASEDTHVAERRQKRNYQRVEILKRMIHRVNMRVFRTQYAKVSVKYLTGRSKAADALLARRSATMDLFKRRVQSLEKLLKNMGGAESNANHDIYSNVANDLASAKEKSRLQALKVSRVAAEAAHAASDLARTEEIIDLQSKASSLTAKSEDEMAIIASVLANTDPTDSMKVHDLRAKIALLQKEVQDAWDKIPDVFYLGLPSETLAGVTEGSLQTEKRYETARMKLHLELENAVGEANKTVIKDRINLLDEKEKLEVTEEQTKAREAMEESPSVRLAAEEARKAAEAAALDRLDAQVLVTKLTLDMKTMSDSSDVKTALLEAQKRLEKAKEAAYSTQKEANDLSDRAAHFTTLSNLRAISKTVEGEVLKKIGGQFTKLEELVRKVTSGPLTQMVEQEIQQAETVDRADAVAAADTATSLVDTAVQKAYDEQIEAEEREKMRLATQEKMGYVTREATRGFATMLRQIAEVDETMSESRLATEAMVIEETALKMAKASLATISVIEHVVKTAMRKSKEGTTLPMEGGAIAAKTWWNPSNLTYDGKGCDTWTHLEIARTSLSIMKNDVASHSLTAKFYALRSNAFAQVKTLRDKYESELASLSTKNSPDDILPEPLQMKRELELAKEMAAVRRAFAEERTKLLVGFTEDQGKLATEAKSTAQLRLKTLDAERIKLEPLTLTPEAPPEDISELMRLCTEVATQANAAKNAAKEKFASSEAAMMATDGATEADSLKAYLQDAEKQGAMAAQLEAKTAVVERKLRLVLDKYERNRRMAAIELTVTQTEIEMQDNFLSVANRLEQDAEEKATRLKTEAKIPSAQYEASEKLVAPLQIQFNMLTREWLNAPSSEEKDVAAAQIQAVYRSIRAIASDGRPDPVDVMAAIELANANVEFARRNLESLKINHGNLLSKVQEMRVIQEGRFSGSTPGSIQAFNSELLMAGSKLRWADESEHRSQYMLDLGEIHLAMSRQTQARIMSTKRQVEDATSNLMKNAEKAFRSTDPTSKLRSNIKHLLKDGQTEIENIFRETLIEVSNATQKSSNNTGWHVRDAVEERSKADLDTEKEFHSHVENQLQLLTNPERCEETEISVTSTENSTVIQNVEVFDCPYSAAQETNYTERLEQQIYEANKNLASGIASVRRVQVLRDAIKATEAATKGMAESMGLGQKVIEAHRIVTERKRRVQSLIDARTAREAHDADEMNINSASKVMLAEINIEKPAIRSPGAWESVLANLKGALKLDTSEMPKFHDDGFIAHTAMSSVAAGRHLLQAADATVAAPLDLGALGSLAVEESELSASEAVLQATKQTLSEHDIKVTYWITSAMAARQLAAKVGKIQAVFATGAGNSPDSLVLHIQGPFQYGSGDPVQEAAYEAEKRAKLERDADVVRNEEELSKAVDPILEKAGEMEAKRDASNTLQDKEYYNEQAKRMYAAARETKKRIEKSLNDQLREKDKARVMANRKIDLEEMEQTLSTDSSTLKNHSNAVLDFAVGLVKQGKNDLASALAVVASLTADKIALTTRLKGISNTDIDEAELAQVSTKLETAQKLVNKLTNDNGLMKKFGEESKDLYESANWYITWLKTTISLKKAMWKATDETKATFVQAADHARSYASIVTGDVAPNRDAACAAAAATATATLDTAYALAMRTGSSVLESFLEGEKKSIEQAAIDAARTQEEQALLAKAADELKAKEDEEKKEKATRTAETELASLGEGLNAKFKKDLAHAEVETMKKVVQEAEARMHDEERQIQRLEAKISSLSVSKEEGTEVSQWRSQLEFKKEEAEVFHSLLANEHAALVDAEAAADNIARNDVRLLHIKQESDVLEKDMEQAATNEQFKLKRNALRKLKAEIELLEDPHSTGSPTAADIESLLLKKSEERDLEKRLVALQNNAKQVHAMYEKEKATNGPNQSALLKEANDLTDQAVNAVSKSVKENVEELGSPGNETVSAPHDPSPSEIAILEATGVYRIHLGAKRAELEGILASNSTDAQEKRVKVQQDITETETAIDNISDKISNFYKRKEIQAEIDRTANRRKVAQQIVDSGEQKIALLFLQKQKAEYVGSDVDASMQMEMDYKIQDLQKQMTAAENVVKQYTGLVQNLSASLAQFKDELLRIATESETKAIEQKALSDLKKNFSKKTQTVATEAVATEAAAVAKATTLMTDAVEKQEVLKTSTVEESSLQKQRVEEAMVLQAKERVATLRTDFEVVMGENRKCNGIMALQGKVSAATESLRTLEERVKELQTEADAAKALLKNTTDTELLDFQQRWEVTQKNNAVTRAQARATKKNQEVAHFISLIDSLNELLTKHSTEGLSLINLTEEDLSIALQNAKIAIGGYTDDEAQKNEFQDQMDKIVDSLNLEVNSHKLAAEGACADAASSTNAVSEGPEMNNEWAKNVDLDLAFSIKAAVRREMSTAQQRLEEAFYEGRVRSAISKHTSIEVPESARTDMLQEIKHAKEMAVVAGNKGRLGEQLSWTNSAQSLQQKIDTSDASLSRLTKLKQRLKVMQHFRTEQEQLENGSGFMTTRLEDLKEMECASSSPQARRVIRGSIRFMHGKLSQMQRSVHWSLKQDEQNTVMKLEALDLQERNAEAQAIVEAATKVKIQLLELQSILNKKAGEAGPQMTEATIGMQATRLSADIDRVEKYRYEADDTMNLIKAEEESHKQQSAAIAANEQTVREALAPLMKQQEEMLERVKAGKTDIERGRARARVREIEDMIDTTENRIRNIVSKQTSLDGRIETTVAQQKNAGSRARDLANGIDATARAVELLKAGIETAVKKRYPAASLQQLHDRLKQQELQLRNMIADRKVIQKLAERLSRKASRLNSIQTVVKNINQKNREIREEYLNKISGFGQTQLNSTCAESAENVGRVVRELRNTIRENTENEVEAAVMMGAQAPEKAVEKEEVLEKIRSLKWRILQKSKTPSTSSQKRWGWIKLGKRKRGIEKQGKSRRSLQRRRRQMQSSRSRCGCQGPEPWKWNERMISKSRRKLWLVRRRLRKSLCRQRMLWLK